MDIILVVMSILGNLLGILCLKNFNISKKIFILIVIDTFLYLFHFPIVYSSIVLVNIFFQKISIDLYFWLGIGMYMTFSILVPLYSYSISIYEKKKKVFDCIVSFLTSTVEFIVFFTVFIVVFTK